MPAWGEDPEPSEPMAHPNLIWIVFDALRAGNLSCMGYSRETSPVMDSLAQQGALFTQHYSQGLETLVSVPSYMSGRYFPVSCLESWACDDWRARFRSVPGHEKLLPEILRENGYTTVLFHTHPFISPRCRLWNAFDEVIELKAPSARLGHADFEALRRAVLSWLDTHPPQPFFVYIHAMDTHVPHFPRPGYTQWLDPGYTSALFRKGKPPSRTCTFDPAAQRHFVGLYDGSLRYADTQLGLLLDALDALELRERTVLAVGSDHGELLGENGKSWGHFSFTADQGMHVPFILAGPGVPKGLRITALTANADIVPTMTALLHCASSAEFHGKSLVPLMKSGSPGPGWREYVCSYYVDSWDTMDEQWGHVGLVLRTKDWKYERFSLLKKTCPPQATEDREVLWQVPDTAAKRVNGPMDDAALLEPFRKIAREQIKPHWEAYCRLPLTSPGQPFRVRVRSPHLIKRPSEAGDNTYSALRIRISIPNGHYDAEAEIVYGKTQPGSAQAPLRMENPATGALQPIFPKDNPKFLDIGEYQTKNNIFELPVEVYRGITIKRLRFTPHTGDAPSPGEDTFEETEEQIRALGYLE